MPALRSLYTLEEVNALVPRLQGLITAQMGRRADIEGTLERLGRLVGKLPDTVEIEASDPPDVRGLKQELLERVSQYQSCWREVEALGAVVKDARSGLVDFHGRVDGKAVWLCWRLGEEAVTHYHALDEGFSARKPIEKAVRDRHLN
jgi:hypothetical protein